MNIIAITTGGFIIEASKSEVNEMLAAVLGKEPKTIEIGMKIPGVDYAKTIKKIRNLKDDYNFKNILSASDDFIKDIERFRKIVNSSRQIAD